MELASITSKIARIFRRRNEPCLHPYVVIDTYKEAVLGTCCYCGEIFEGTIEVMVESENETLHHTPSPSLPLLLP